MRTTPLSPIDVAFVGRDGYSIEFLQRFSRPLDEDRLAAALENALEVFWPLRGRLAEDARAGLRVVESDARTDFVVVSPRPALDARSPREGRRSLKSALQHRRSRGGAWSYRSPRGR